MSEQETIAKWVNDLAGDYIESWVGDMVAEAWIKDKERITALEKVAEAGVKLKTFHTAFADNNELVFYSIAARDAFDEHTETLRAAGYDIAKEQGK